MRKNGRKGEENTKQSEIRKETKKNKKRGMVKRKTMGL
jgi:hypothetical protein